MNNLSKIINNNVDTIAFVVGNGINHQFNRSVISWKDLLKDLWLRYAKDGNADFIDDGDLTYTEIYDLIELKHKKWEKQQESFNKITTTYINSLKGNIKDAQLPKLSSAKEIENFPVTISSKVIEYANKMEGKLSEGVKNVFNSYDLFPQNYASYDNIAIAQNIATRGELQSLLMIKKEINKQFESAILEKRALEFLSFAQKSDIPILTTNYDLAMANLLKLKRYQMPQSNSNQYLYPVATYFGNKPLENATDGFGIWHANGMVGYQNSIRLGLSDYMDLVQYLRELMCIDKKYGLESLSALNSSEWDGTKTWLNIIFKKSLFIFGLGLNQDEVPLRWLLLQRERFNSTFNKGLKGWYVCCETEEISPNKRIFLENVGIEIVTVENYDYLYEGLWKDVTFKK